MKQNILYFLNEDSHKPDVFVPITVKQKQVSTATGELFLVHTGVDTQLAHSLAC